MLSIIWNSLIYHWIKNCHLIGNVEGSLYCWEHPGHIESEIFKTFAHLNSIFAMYSVFCIASTREISFLIFASLLVQPGWQKTGGGLTWEPRCRWWPAPPPGSSGRCSWSAQSLQIAAGGRLVCDTEELNNLILWYLDQQARVQILHEGWHIIKLSKEHRKHLGDSIL